MLHLGIFTQLFIVNFFGLLNESKSNKYYEVGENFSCAAANFDVDLEKADGEVATEDTRKKPLRNPQSNTVQLRL